MKKQILFLTILLSCSITYAQNVGIGTSTPKARLHVADSAVVFTAPNSMLQTPPPVQGAGTRMMWYPYMAAFRVGSVSGAQWDNGNIGYESFAAGHNTIASGFTSIAIGNQCTATGETSISLGAFNTASGDNSVAIGSGNSGSGANSNTIGRNNIVSGAFANALGNENSSTANNSTTLGRKNTASGISSMALGDSTTANGRYSLSTGNGTLASGQYTTAMGKGTTSKAYGSVAMGMYNDNSDNPSYNTANTTDRIFQIGNGSSISDLSNALTGLRNGNFGFGTVNPSQKIDIGNGRLRFTGNPSASVSQGIEFTNNAGTALNGFVGQYNDSIIGMYGFTGAGWQFLWNGKNGNLGLQGNNNPRAALSFANSGGNKIALYGNAETPHYGFGIGTGLLQMYCANAADNIGFGYGSSTAFTERMRIQGNGNIGIGTTAPSVKLEVNGKVKVIDSTLLKGELQLSGVGATYQNSGVFLGVSNKGKAQPGRVLTATDTFGNTIWQNSTNNGAFMAMLDNYYYRTQLINDRIPFKTNYAPNTGFDDIGGYNNNSGLFVAPTNGVYYFEVDVNFTQLLSPVINGSTILSSNFVYIYRNGSSTNNYSYLGNSINEDRNGYKHISCLLKLIAGDTVDVRIITDGGYPASGSNGYFSVSENSKFLGYRLY